MFSTNSWYNYIQKKFFAQTNYRIKLGFYRSADLVKWCLDVAAADTSKQSLTQTANFIKNSV